MQTPEKIILAWSGGKDSSYALWELMQDKRYEVVGLLSTINGLNKRLSMHGIIEQLIEQQAASIGLPLYKVYVYEASNTAYEAQLNATLLQLKAAGITTIAYGDIFLEDLKQYRLQKMKEIGMNCHFPLWGRNTRTLVAAFIALGFKSITCCINDGYLDASWCGRLIDTDFVAALPPAADPCGENGEYHSFCYAGPVFREKISIQTGEKIYQPIPPGTNHHPTPIPDVGTKGFWFIDIQPA